jgi:hypothetical protein
MSNVDPSEIVFRLYGMTASVLPIGLLAISVAIMTIKGRVVILLLGFARIL